MSTRRGGKGGVIVRPEEPKKDRASVRAVHASAAFASV